MTGPSVAATPEAAEPASADPRVRIAWELMMWAFGRSGDDRSSLMSAPLRRWAAQLSRRLSAYSGASTEAAPAKERVTRVKALGVNGSTSTLWLCLVDGEQALETNPTSLELRAGHEAGYAFGAFRDECTHALKALSPDRVVILDMEQTRQVPKVADMRARFTAEALLATCAIDAGLPCLRMPRPTLRARLSLRRISSPRRYPPIGRPALSWRLLLLARPTDGPACRRGWIHRGTRYGAHRRARYLCVCEECRPVPHVRLGRKPDRDPDLARAELLQLPAVAAGCVGYHPSVMGDREARQAAWSR